MLQSTEPSVPQEHTAHALRHLSAEVGALLEVEAAGGLVAVVVVAVADVAGTAAVVRGIVGASWCGVAHAVARPSSSRSMRLANLQRKRAGAIILPADQACGAALGLPGPAHLIWLG